MLVSRKSGPGMKVCPRPGPLAKLQSNLPEGALERFALTPLSAGCRVFGGNVFQIRANHPRESRVTLDGDFPDFFNQFVLERQCDVHKPIIREPLKLCKSAILASRRPLQSGSQRQKPPLRQAAELPGPFASLRVTSTPWHSEPVRSPFANGPERSRRGSR